MIRVYDPYRTDNINVAGKQYPLAANFSAPYGLWLAENNLGVAAYLSLIDRDQHLTMPHLYMLEPYNPNKKLLCWSMVWQVAPRHGLRSPTMSWVILF